MSRDARAWVRTRSPLTGSNFCVHLVMADAVDKHRILRMHQANLAAEARVSRMSVSRALSAMIDLGLLERVDTPEQENTRRACHQPLRFRMLFPEAAPVVVPSSAPLSQGVASPLEEDPEPLRQGVTSDPHPMRHPVTATLDPPSHGVTSKEQELEEQQELSLQQELPPAPLASKAEIHLFPVPDVEPAVPAGPRAVARLMLDDWWSQQDPKPQQPYIAVLKVMTKALKDGWGERDLREALDSVPIMSGGALDFWRKRRSGTRRLSYGTGSRSAGQIADDAVTELNDLLGMNR